MKKVFYLLLALTMTMSFVSCEEETEGTASGEVPNSDVTLTISKNSLQYDAEGGTQLITITTNANYAGAESFVEWVSFKINGTQLQVICAPNPSTEERTGKILVSVGATSDYQATNQRQNYVYATVTQKGASSSGPKWVLVGYEATNFTDYDVTKGNANKVNPNFHTDSLKMVAANSTCSGFYSETFIGSGSWHDGTFLFRFEVSQIPMQLEGGGTISLYSKVSLPRHYGGYDDHNDYAEYAYYHCFCYADCRIDGNKIRSKEEDFPKFNGYNLPIVSMYEKTDDLFASEGYVYGEVPKGKKAGDRIKLTIEARHGVSGPVLDLNGKYMEAAYTYEWRE